MNVAIMTCIGTFILGTWPNPASPTAFHELVRQTPVKSPENQGDSKHDLLTNTLRLL
jgi:hypothetical protein